MTKISLEQKKKKKKKRPKYPKKCKSRPIDDQDGDLNDSRTSIIYLSKIFSPKIRG